MAPASHRARRGRTPEPGRHPGTAHSRRVEGQAGDHRRA